MDINNSIEQHKLTQKIVLRFATLMKWIPHEDSRLLEDYVKKLDKEILRRKNEESTKARRKSRRSVCVRRAPSCSSSDDDDIETPGGCVDYDNGDDNSDCHKGEADHDGGDGNDGDSSDCHKGEVDDDGDDSDSSDCHKGEVDDDRDDKSHDEDEGNCEDNGGNDHDKSNAVDDIYVGVNGQVDKGRESTERENSNFNDQESEEEDDFDAFINKVKSWRSNIILSSDEEGRDEMGSFIDDSGLNTNRKVWQEPRKTETIDLSSDSDENQDERPAERPSVRKKLPSQAFYTPFKTPKAMNFTPSILSSVRAPKTPHGSASYKREYKKLRNETASDLFNLFNKTVFDNRLPKDLKIVFNKRLTKTAGFCYYYRDTFTKVRSSKIEIAEKVCDTVERLRDTVIHEMCHAAAWIINGLKCGHGSHWKYWAGKAHKAHPDLPPISVCHQFDIECKFNFKCMNPYCGRSYGRHSKSLKKCPQCLGSLQILGKDGVTPLKQKEPSKFALYVKEEYPITKRDNPQMTHAEIMKLLGQNFSKLST